MKYNIKTDDELMKEVYAYFGLAVYFGQCLEQALINAISVIAASKEMKRAGELFEKHQKEGLEATLGKLCSTIKGLAPLSTELQHELNEARDMRNYLCHNYWKEKIFLMTTTKGCHESIRNFKSYKIKFESTANKIETLEAQAYRVLGVSQENLEKFTATYISQETQKEKIKYQSIYPHSF